MHSPSLVISRPHPKWIFSVYGIASSHLAQIGLHGNRTEAMVSERNAARTERGLGKSIPPKITAALSFCISLCPMQLYLSNLKDKKKLTFECRLCVFLSSVAAAYNFFLNCSLRGSASQTSVRQRHLFHSTPRSTNGTIHMTSKEIEDLLTYPLDM